jgi:hypothetical protein
MRRLFTFREAVAERLRGVVPVEERIRSRNELLRDLFEKDVCAAGWQRLRPGERFLPVEGRRSVVVGSVVWSDKDLEILAKLAEEARDDTDIYIFNLDDVHSEDDLRSFMPGASLPTTTPVVAEYLEGALRRYARRLGGHGALRSLRACCCRHRCIFERRAYS